MRIYLDNCCLGRLFDDDQQDRVRLEAEAILLILEHVTVKDFTWVASEVLAEEVKRNPDSECRRRIEAILSFATTTVDMTESEVQEASRLQGLGFGVFDSFHLVAARKGRCDVLLTTDDRLLRRAKQHRSRLGLRVENPIDWLREVASDENT